MNYYIIIPTYNEEKFISLTLQSLVEQTVLPSKVVVVNDGSTDKTEEIVKSFVEKYSYISLVNKSSDAIHLPGSKVIQAFIKSDLEKKVVLLAGPRQWTVILSKKVNLPYVFQVHLKNTKLEQAPTARFG